MAKYRALTLLWSISQNRYIQPGELVEMDSEDKTTKILLKKNCITIAEFKKPILVHAELPNMGKTESVDVLIKSESTKAKRKPKSFRDPRIIQEE